VIIFELTKDLDFFYYLCTVKTEMMEIKTAEFTLSAPMVSMCPQDTKPEYAFIGRSNVGKSSLINMLTNHKKLAKTSQTPGKTLLINHFIINKEWYLVDLPGYGYAKRSKKEVDKLDQMIRGYILQREQLVNVFVLVDVRLEPQKIDLEFIEWLGLSSVPFAIVFTKADKLTPNKARQAVEAYKKTLLETWEELPPIFLTSAEKKEGRDEVLDYIEQINSQLFNS
jgi:GTP-binding protein